MVYWLVFINVAWDFVSALAIASGFDFISKYHTDIWTNDNDKSNYAARTLMAWWVLSLGMARFVSIYDPSSYLLCGLLSYLLEAAFGMIGIITHTIKLPEGAAIMGLSLLLAVLLLV